MAAFLVTMDASAQIINLYSRMTDPRSIARLDLPDSSPMKAVTFHGDAKWNIDSADHIPDVATDTGSGVITHIWSTHGGADSDVVLWLYINDTLILHDHYNEFFTKLRGLFRPPLDTVTDGANDWDVQIPYHRGFRLAMLSSDGNVYFAFEWHHVSDDVVPWIPLPALTTPATQAEAENRYYYMGSPWHDSDAITLERTDTLAPRSAIAVADLTGPAMLEMLRFIPGSYDFNSLDSLWLNIYWDHCPVPSVHVPLKDFFLSPVNVTRVRALQVHADRDSGFISYFAMPFAVHARVELVRTGSAPITIQSLVQYHHEPIDRNQYGYFHADFSESNPTKYHVWHPVIHTVGRGRYIGFGWGIMGHPFPEFLEGNPRFQVDSDQSYFIEYTGGEDYLDGAWWLGGGVYTLPFAGYTDPIDQFYRFHDLDCYEFDHSFDFDFQPGNAEDVYDHFRTVGYYYKHWTPFWTNRDTLVPGETWTVAGTGYAPFSQLSITLGPEALSLTTNDSGAFSTSLIVPGSWKPGIYFLSINGESAPEKYYILRSPAIRPLVDTLPITLCAGDSLWVKGLGFRPGETVSFYLDSIPMNQSVVTNSNSEFVTMLRMPYVAEHSYLLVARGAISGNATAEVPVTSTRAFDFEFEDLMPPTYVTPGQCYAEDVSYFWEATWSKQMYVYFKPDSILAGAALEFQFRIAHPDTFEMTYHGSIGADQGRYAVRLDGDSIATIDGYVPPGSWDPLPSGPIDMGTHYLSSGVHRIRFTCLGKEDSATNYWVQPDCLVLKPTTYMAPTPGTILADVNGPGPNDSGTVSRRFSLQIYPNPVHNGAATLTLSLSDPNFSNAVATVRIFDALGRNVQAHLIGYLANGTLTGTLEFPIALSGTYYIKILLTALNGAVMELPIQPIKID